MSPERTAFTPMELRRLQHIAGLMAVNADLVSEPTLRTLCCEVRDLLGPVSALDYPMRWRVADRIFLGKLRDVLERCEGLPDA